MGRLTWSDAKEIVEISLELGHTNQAIVNDIRNREGTDLISAIHQTFGLLAVADHPLAEERYESMRANFSRFNNAPSWLNARLKLRASMPTKETLR